MPDYLKKETRRSLRRLAVTAVIFLLALGCGSWVTAEEPEITLWVVTERTQETGMNKIVQDVVEAFSSAHRNVSFNLEILPIGDRDRARRMDEIWELIEQGDGPDVLLLPTKAAASQGMKSKGIEPLFSSIPYAMRQGRFLNISQYYDKDEALDKNGLQQTVMDAGCVGDKRFLLPICFNLNAYYFLSDSVNSDLWPDMTILDVMDYGIRSDDSLLAKILTANSIAMYRPEMVFSSLIDYDTGRVTLSFGEAEEFFDRFQKLREMAEEDGAEDYISNSSSIWGYVKTPASKRVLYPCYLEGISHVMALRGISQLENKELSAIPLRASNGAVTAIVNYYGAIGANCKNSRTAYEFLRMFLLPEYQWQVSETDILALDGWPVRVKGSVEAMWAQICNNIDSQKIRHQLESLGASDVWVTELTDQITRAEFRIDIYLTNSLEQINSTK